MLTQRASQLGSWQAPTTRVHATAQEAKQEGVLGPGLWRRLTTSYDLSDHHATCWKEAVSRRSLLSQKLLAEGHLQAKRRLPLCSHQGTCQISPPLRLPPTQWAAANTRAHRWTPGTADTV